MPEPGLLQVGFNASLDIPAALSKLSASQLASDLVLVSMIDSTPNVSQLLSLVPLLERESRWYASVDGDVVVEITTLMALIHDHEFLTGFDEIWLCTALPASGKPKHLRITSDVPLGTEAPRGLAEWMVDSSCRAGLGDGDGLNFATFEPALAAAWQGAES